MGLTQPNGQNPSLRLRGGLRGCGRGESYLPLALAPLAGMKGCGGIKGGEHSTA